MATMGKRDGGWLERFKEALLEAFPQRVDLEQMILFDLGQDLDVIALGANQQNTIFALLKWARARGEIDRLLDKACTRNPGNLALRAVAEDRAPFILPFAKDRGFVGRGDDIDHLHRLLQESAAPCRAALIGMGGIGKTQLAVEYAYHHRRAYPGGIYWVNAAAPLVSGLGKLAEKLGLDEDGAAEEDRPGQRLHAFERHLREHPGALLIFDNVADPLALREPAAGVIPWDLPCRLLFTTRRRDPDPHFEVIPVGVLPKDAAVSLLLSSKARQPILEKGHSDDIPAARAICGALGHLPLAIVLAAAYLGKFPHLPLSGYLARLRREGGLSTADAVHIDPLKLATQHAAAIEATLRAQWDALGNPEAQRALMTAALLRDAAHVSRATLARLTGLSDEAKDGYAAPLEQALNELSEWSLVEELTQKAIRLHPLVREFAAARIEDHQVFAAGCAKRLGDALGEMRGIEKEVRARGLDAVLADLRLGEDLAGAAGRDRFRRLLRPLDRSAHCLRRWDPVRDPGFFLQQIRNVSFELGVTEVEAQAEAALADREWAWLRERTQTSRESEALIRTLAGHTSSVWGVAVTPDGRSALSVSHDKSLKVWEISSGCELRTLAGHSSEINGVAVTPQGDFAISASDDCTLKVWDLATDRLVCTLEGHSDAVNGVAVTPDGRLAISASTDSTLKLWDLATRRLVRTSSGHSARVNGVTVTRDGSLAISASDDCTLKVWTVATGRVAHTLEGHTDSVMKVAVTPDGCLAVSASTDHTLKVWDLATGREIRALEGHDDWVNGVAVTPDGRLAISASSDHTLKVWELASGREVHTLKGHTDAVIEVALTPDGYLAVSASHDRTLKVWELVSGREIRAPEGHTAAVPGIAVTPDGRLALSASWDGTLKVWNLSTLDQVRTLEGHTSQVMQVAASSAGGLVVSASEDTTLKVWDLATGREIHTLAGHRWSVTGVAVTPDGRLAVSASGDKTLKVWDLASGREIRTLEGNTSGVTCVAVTPDGRSVVSAQSDRTLKVWDLETGHAMRVLAGHAGDVTAVAVTPDDRWILSASEDTTLRVWDLATGREARTLAGHTGRVTGVAVTPNGRLAISTSEDTTLRVWDLESWRCVATLEAHAPLLSCVSAPDGCTFLAGDGAGSLHVLDWISPLTALRERRDARNGDALRAPAVRRTIPAIPAPPPVEPPRVTRPQARLAEVPSGPGALPPGPSSSAERIKILFLASNPMSTRQLNVVREARHIEERIGVGKARDGCELVPSWAVRRSDLQRLLLAEKPHVLHFSSHGSARAELTLEDDDGNAAPVEKKVLVDLFGILRHRPQLVVLNACNTEPLARALVQHVACAIGMRQSIGDEAALAFAASFYQALAFGEPVATAFRLACNELRLRRIPEEQTPILKVKRGVDAATLVLTR